MAWVTLGAKMDERKESAKIIITNRPKHMIHMSEQRHYTVILWLLNVTQMNCDRQAFDDWARHTHTHTYTRTRPYRVIRWTKRHIIVNTRPALYRPRPAFPRRCFVSRSAPPRLSSPLPALRWVGSLPWVCCWKSQSCFLSARPRRDPSCKTWPTGWRRLQLEWGSTPVELPGLRPLLKPWRPIQYVARQQQIYCWEKQGKNT